MVEQKNKQVVYQEENKPQNKAVFGWALLLILLLLSFSLAVFSWYKTKNASSSAPTDQKKQQEIFIDETANWKTYRNEEYGFEVKYPETARIIEKPFSILIGIMDENGGHNPYKGEWSFGISILNNFLHLTAKGWYEKDKTQEQLNDLMVNLYRKEIIINGMPFYQVGHWAGDGEKREFYISKEDKIFNFHCSVDLKENNPYTEEHQKIYNQILSTFKFIDQENVDISNWKTYRNEEYGFSLKLPKNWENYKVTEGNGIVNKEVKSFEFYLPLKSGKLGSVFIISIYPKKIWKERIKEEGPQPTYFDENDKYIFSYSLGHDDEGYVGFPDVKPNEIYKGPIYEAQHFIFPTFVIDNSIWKTYQNDKYGYEIKYPENWYIYDYLYNGGKSRENVDIQNFLRPKEGGYSGIGGNGCQINVHVYQGYSSIQNWIKKRKIDFGSAFEKLTTKNFEAGNIKGLEVIFFGDFIGTGAPNIILFEKENLYNISKIWQGVFEKDCEPIFSQILPTFKFIE